MLVPACPKSPVSQFCGGNVRVPFTRTSPCRTIAYHEGFSRRRQVGVASRHAFVRSISLPSKASFSGGPATSQPSALYLDAALLLSSLETIAAHEQSVTTAVIAYVLLRSIKVERS